MTLRTAKKVLKSAYKQKPYGSSYKKSTLKKARKRYFKWLKRFHPNTYYTIQMNQDWERMRQQMVDILPKMQFNVRLAPEVYKDWQKKNKQQGKNNAEGTGPPQGNSLHHR